MEFKDIVKQRYAAKNFDGKVIAEEKIEELLEIIRFAPSALNLQPWKIMVITDQKVKDELLPATFGQEQVKTCSLLLVFFANRNIDELIEKLGKIMKDAGIQDELIDTRVTISKNLFCSISPDEKLEWAKCQVYLALGNAVNGAKSLGLDSCPMTGFNPDEYTKILGIPTHLVPVAICPVGYGVDEPIPKTRFPKEDIFFS